MFKLFIIGDICFIYSFVHCHFFNQLHDEVTLWMKCVSKAIIMANVDDDDCF